MRFSSQTADASVDSRWSFRQWAALILSTLLLVAGFGLAFARWQRYREVRDPRSAEPPPEVLAWREERKSPFAEGLSREERIERFKTYGKDAWQKSTTQEKMMVAGGYFEDVVRQLKLTPEQLGPVRQVYDGCIRSLIAVWEGWWQPNFSREGAFFKSMLIAGQARQALEPVLNAEQKEKLDRWLTEARTANEERRKREAERAAKSATPPTTTSATVQ